MTRFYALKTNNGEWRVARKEFWEKEFDWIVFEVMWESFAFKEVYSKDGKWYFSNK